MGAYIYIQCGLKQQNITKAEHTARIKKKLSTLFDFIKELSINNN